MGYPISDDLGHYHNDTLSALNDKIRQQLLSQQGRRGIIDDLKRRVKPGDLVLVTSDHGFQELFPGEATTISRLDALQSGAKEEDIAYRYLRFNPKQSSLSPDCVSMEWEEIGPGGRRDKTSYVLAVGGKWFQREGGHSARFAHGGISFAEMAIPGTLLKLIEQKAARVEFAGLMTDLTVGEDETEDFEFEIVNVGNVDAKYQLMVETNLGDRLVDKQGILASGKRETMPIAHGKTAEIALWHPIGRDVEEIMSWRQKLEDLKIVQPFKQAHREVYLLTEAERNTHTYSNRFAANILRQHQFNALCAARGWKNKLRLMVDDAYPPATKPLPLWGLRAEFWIEGIGQDYGTDTNESGVYLRLSTDQVRFYRTDASINYAHAGGGGYDSSAAGPGQNNINEPLPLDQIPPLVLSEIMRDVDLFVGVASVGNDPTWQDGGPEGRYRDYWHSYSFGELSGTATTRKQVLERLVPRLKIASQCSFSDRFLVVQGKKRTYKIHLGSGNILMEPNDQYLCIVPDARSQSKQDELFLPFEGDNTLSIIISKALLLAEDTKIKDPTILRQIEVAG